MKLREIILSWDTAFALVGTLITCLLLPGQLIKVAFCLAFYNIGITVLSIIFSLFFSALAIIMSSSDNDFILFMEEEGDYTALIGSFKITLSMLFISLVVSIILAVYTSYLQINYTPYQHKAFFLFFECLFIYSLIATILSVKDTIVFSHFRTKFLKNKPEKIDKTAI